ncbi:LCP family protein [Actinoplanes regularis]|uniref:LCP family protein n=1 Tax=Actinoplanes regularis TaxID=52697 RepID=UPI0024A291AD|nr:LCP family protein [Actinoplanes regularis]GLW34038.1 hypothetical protein Areg01_69750 [Actinoplanes regularis]
MNKIEEPDGAMSRVEEELRAAFERQEALVPDAAPMRDRIDFAWVRVKRRRAKRRVIGAAVAVLIAGVAVPVVSTSWWHGGQPVPAIGTADMRTPVSGPVDVLLLGTDRRAGSAARRADTIMLLHVPADRNSAWMISLPRNGLVEIPGHGRQKLTASLALGGPELTRATVAKLTGVDLDATVTVDLAALSAVTEGVGGVTVCLDQAIPPQAGRKGLAAGCQRIEGDDVAPLLQGQDGLKRFALDRDQNNRRFLRALAARVTTDDSMADPARFQQLLDAGREGVRIDSDAIDLLGVVAKLWNADLVGVGQPTFNSAADGEIVDSAPWLSLYQAIRDDQLRSWAEANPSFIDR